MATQFVRYPKDSSSSSSGPIEFVLNGSDQEVVKDTGTPANNIPLPVQLLDTSGNVNTVTIGGTVPLPTGAATAAKQDTGNASLASLDGKTVAVNTGAVVVASSALPSGASTSAKQPALGTAGTASADVITIQGIASMTALAVSAAALPLPSGAATSANQVTELASLASIDGKLGSLGQKAMAGSAPVVIASDQSAVATKSPVNSAGSSPGSSTVSTVATISAPANTVGFILMNLSSSTDNIRYRIGATATSSSGQRLEPGRDSGFIPCSANISICAESGTQNYDAQFILSS